MNAKKIMGAVLVALLAAALFTGAVAADNKGTYFAFQNGTAGIEGVWMNGDNKVTVTGGVVSAVPVNITSETFRYRPCRNKSSSRQYKRRCVKLNCLFVDIHHLLTY